MIYDDVVVLQFLQLLDFILLRERRGLSFVRSAVLRLSVEQPAVKILAHLFFLAAHSTIC